jgi:hypothetical protein
MDSDSHVDGSLWIDKEAEMRLRKTIASVDNMIYQDCSYHSENPLLICQNIDTRAAKEESDEWRDWTGFFAIRVLGTHPSSCSILAPCNDADDYEEEIFDVDESDNSGDQTLENIKLALLDGLVKSILSGLSDVSSSALKPKNPLSEASTSGKDFMCTGKVERCVFSAKFDSTHY